MLAVRDLRLSHEVLDRNVAVMTDTQRNRLVISAAFEALAQGDPRAFVDAFADDSTWTFPGSWSWSGSWSPKTRIVQELLQPLMAQFADRYTACADSVFADGDHVVVQARGGATTHSGERYDQTYCYVFRMRDGLIEDVVEHCDTALVERVLQPLVAPFGHDLEA